MTQMTQPVTLLAIALMCDVPDAVFNALPNGSTCDGRIDWAGDFQVRSTYRVTV